MLTPDDINDARESLRCNNVPRYNTIYAALAAYSRVAALLVDSEAHEAEVAAKNPKIMRLLRKYEPPRMLTCAKLRRALKG